MEGKQRRVPMELDYALTCAQTPSCVSDGWAACDHSARDRHQNTAIECNLTLKFDHLLRFAKACNPEYEPSDKVAAYLEPIS